MCSDTVEWILYAQLLLQSLSLADVLLFLLFLAAEAETVDPAVAMRQSTCMQATIAAYTCPKW